MPRPHVSLDASPEMNRRQFVGSVAGATLAVGSMAVGVGTFARAATPPADVETNIGEFLAAPRTPGSLPGPFPGRVVKVTDARALVNERIDAKVVAEMFERGVRTLTGTTMKQSFRMLFSTDDVVGLKVNPVGAPLISTRPELVEAVIRWLVGNGIRRSNIVIWDRFDLEIAAAGFTAERFPGVRIEALQTMAEEGQSFLDAGGRHVSAGNFDPDVYYLAKGVLGRGVGGYKDDQFYLNQHVFAGERSFFGKLLTRRLTKIVNLAAYKNTGNGISMATKNIAYASICNTGRLHAPLGFKVCTEVLAAPVVRDKLALNITDGLRGQYEGGPDKNERFVFPNCSLYFATDPFAADAVCHREVVAKRREMGITVNEHPRYTEYLSYAERIGLGIADRAKIQVEHA